MRWVLPLLLPLLIAQAAPSTGPALSGLVRDLSSDDFATRTAAHKQIEALPPSQRSALEAAINSAGDPEVKSRLLARADAFDEHAALNPPPISLELQNATPAQIVEALNKAAGDRFEKMILSDSAGTHCTLSVKDVPLMEAFRQIALQTPLVYGPDPGRINLRFVRPDRPPHLTPFASGPLVIFAEHGAPAATAVPVPGGGMPIRIVSYADPRMILFGQSLFFTSAADDAGNTLSLNEASGEPRARTGPGMDELDRINQKMVNVNVGRPADPKATITLKGQADLHVVTKSATYTLADPEKHVDEPIRIGGRTITLTKLRIIGQPGTVDLGISVTPASVVPVMNGGETEGSAEKCPIYFTFTDSVGKSFTHRVSGTGMPTILIRTAKAPYTMTFTAPLKWKLLTVPVELKEFGQG